MNYSRAERRTIPELDGLRGVAILLVFLTHFIAQSLDRHAMGVDGAVRWVARFGWTGVDLFFVLSGFLITGILLDTRGQPNYWRNYAARRFLRIFPLYYGALALVMFVVPLSGWRDPALGVLRHNQAWYWTYTVNFLEALRGPAATPLNTEHFWSLCIEEQFYLVWPLVVLLASRRTLLRIAAFTCVFGVAFRWWLLGQPVDPSATYVLTPGRLDGLMIGAVLAVAQREGGLERWRPLAWRVASAAAALVVALALWRGMEHSDPVMAVIGYPAIAVGFGGLLVLSLTGPDGALRRLLSQRHLRSWGKYSYGLYVIHYPVVGALWEKLGSHADRWVWRGSHLPGIAVITAMGVPLSYGIAWLSYNLYEKRFLALKHHFEPRST